jgi:LAO/AO transport system kinase
MSQKISIGKLARDLRTGDRCALGRAITLVESTSLLHSKYAAKLLSSLDFDNLGSIRVAITGVPGVGKSTFIEALGLHLLAQGHKVAVLAVDPSSIHGGSILGDKTRMEKLSRDERCFIRPSPSGRTPGGVARNTYETMLLCEAAGFDVILIETVGVGQGENIVRNMVDCFVLLLLPNAGDHLQGIKRGIMEMADLLFINKADGSFLKEASNAVSNYSSALQFMRPATEGWSPVIMEISALEEKNIKKAWQSIEDFIDFCKSTDVYATLRKNKGSGF